MGKRGGNKPTPKPTGEQTHGWFTDAEGRTRNRSTGASNMREHREMKALQAYARNPEHTIPRAQRAGAVVAVAAKPKRTNPSPNKRSRQSRQKAKQNRLTAERFDRVTKNWLENTGPGVDF